MHYYQDEPSGKHALCSLPGAVEPKWHLPYVIYIIPELAGPPLVPCAFIHESKLTQSSCDTLKRVWTSHGEHYAACNIIQHDRFGGGSVIVLWGRPVQGRLTAIRHWDEVCRQFLEREGIDTITLPPRPPDLNPIARIWDTILPGCTSDCPGVQQWSRSGQRSCRTSSII